MQADDINIVEGRFRLDPEDDRALIQAVMREARRRAGMTREQFGDALGVGAGAIFAYETGGAMPVVNVWYRALRAAGVDSRPFFTRWVDHARAGAVDRLQRRFCADVDRVGQLLVGALALRLVGPMLLAATATWSPWW
jgi:transcriptional regulator with XRE-family HTH domain